VPHVYVHFLGDGRDTAPRSAAGYARELRDYIQKVGIGQVATIVGRYYAMDRDKRWDRVKIAVDGLVHGKGEAIAEDGDYVKAIEARYEKDETDEFLKPIIVNGDSGRIKGGFFPLYSYQIFIYCMVVTIDGDTLFLFNYRSDRMREISTVLGQLAKPVEVDIPKDLVSSSSFPRTSSFLLYILRKLTAHNHHVPLQCGVPVSSCLPASSDD
jgi:2,3-bisphosphoglycerate-independent phosphoglycerate mutase